MNLIEVTYRESEIFDAAHRAARSAFFGACDEEAAKSSRLSELERTEQNLMLMLASVKAVREALERQ